MRQKGFTLVELIIVIVVIGILSTIGIVSYNGAQQRARNASRLSAVTTAIEMVEVALTRNSPSTIRGTLGYSSSWWRGCIGSGYADKSGDGVGDCGYYGTSAYVSESAAFSNLMKSDVGTFDLASYPTTTATDGDIVSGPYLDSAWVDSKDMLAVEYTLEGLNQKCDKTPLIYRSGSTSTMTPPAGNAANYTKSEYGVTECAVAVVTNYY